MESKSTKQRNRIAIVGLTPLTLTLVLFSPSPATGAPAQAIATESISNSSPAIGQHVSSRVPAASANSEPLPVRVSLAADEIRTMANPEGYAGQVVDLANKTITVYWHGAPSEDLKTYASSQHYGIEIDLVPQARFTRAEVMNASNKLIASPTWIERLDLIETSVRPDGSGLTVRVLGATPDDEMKSELEGQLGLAGGLFFEGDTDKMVLQSTRNADAAPWTAGQRIKTSNGQCTSGFNVLFGSIGHIATANH